MSRTNPPRRLHLVDVENLLGDARPSESQVRRCAEHFATVAAFAPDDQCVVACNHGAAASVSFGWMGARLLQRSGPDGADHALLEVLDHERVAQRFASVVIGSGDGIFAEPAARLAAAGVSVTAISVRRALSRRLELAASRVVHLDGDLPPAGTGFLSEAA